MIRCIAELCQEHDRFLSQYPLRPALLQLLADNNLDSDDAEAVADAIIDLMVPIEHIKEAECHD